MELVYNKNVIISKANYTSKKIFSVLYVSWALHV